MKPLERFAPERDRGLAYKIGEEVEISRRKQWQFAVLKPAYGEVILAAEVQFDRHFSIASDMGCQHQENRLLELFQVRNGTSIRLRTVLDYRTEYQLTYGVAVECSLGDIVTPGRLNACSKFHPRLSRNRLEDAVGKDGEDLTAIEIIPPFFGPYMHLERSDIVHKCPQLAAVHRVAHSDVDVGYARGNGVEDWQKLRLIGQDDRRLDACRPQPVEDGRQLLGLAYGGRDAEDAEFGFRQALIVQAESLRKVSDIVLHKERGHILVVLEHIAAEIPAELRQPCIPQLGHQAQFAFIGSIESDEDETDDIRKLLRDQIHCRLVCEALGQATIYGSLVGHPIGFERCVEVPVQRVEDIPDLAEPAFVLPSGPEMRHELSYGGQLLGAQISECILNALEVINVGE